MKKNGTKQWFSKLLGLRPPLLLKFITENPKDVFIYVGYIYQYFTTSEIKTEIFTC